MFFRTFQFVVHLGLGFITFTSSLQSPLPPNGSGKPAVSKLPILPLMPFSISELLLPGQTRSLHLYEARFLSLLEHAQTHSNNLVCVGLESNNGLLSLSVLASLSKVKRLEVGVSCDLKAIQTLSLHNLLPYSEDYPFLLANCTAKPLIGDAQRCTDLYEKLTTISSSITEISNGQNVPISSNVELKIDPRAILGSIKPDDSKKAVSLKDRSEKVSRFEQTSQRRRYSSSD